MNSKDLLKATLDHIKEVPEGWDQTNWRAVEGLAEGVPKLLPTTCGTAMCFAGEAITIARPDAWLISLADIKEAQATGDMDAMWTMDRYLEYVKADEDDPSGFMVKHPLTGVHYRVVTARNYAQRLLGLSNRSAEVLFNESNVVEDLEDMVKLLLDDERIFYPGDENSDD